MSSERRMRPRILPKVRPVAAGSGWSVTGNPLCVVLFSTSTMLPTVSMGLRVTTGWDITSLAYVLAERGGGSQPSNGTPASCI